ncbi:MAG: 3-phosphoshikimate 1-carboxyvinyltransferase [Balneolales bacterium]
MKNYRSMKQTIHPAGSLGGTITLPPDKSIAQRAALFSLLSSQTSIISNYPKAEDPQTALRCVEQLGAMVTESADTVTIQGTGRDGIINTPGVIDCGNSGTVMRMLSGILAGAGVEAVLTGDDSLKARPMKRIIDPLTQMGATVHSEKGGIPPLHLSRTGFLKPITFRLPVASAQLKSCVLLGGLFGEEPTKVIETVATRNHTEGMLRLPVTRQEGVTIISSYRGLSIPVQSITIPGDFSAAAFWLVAGSIGRDSEIFLPAVGINPTRCAALHILQRMGADIEISNRKMSGMEPTADLRVRSAPLKPVEIHSDEIPNAIDELPVLSVAMAFANGISRITGAHELRFKESDRLAAIQEILIRAGIHVEVENDSLTIYGKTDRVIQSAVYDSRHDHRIAMSAAILSLRADGLSEINHAEAAAVSYPEFWSHLDSLHQ